MSICVCNAISDGICRAVVLLSPLSLPALTKKCPGVIMAITEAFLGCESVME